MAFVNAVPLAAPLWLEESNVFHASSLRKLVQLYSRGSNGVMGANDLLVTPTTPASMAVHVGAGDAIGQSPDPVQGSYILTVPPAGEQVTVPAADATNPRNDIVALQVQDPDYQGTALAANVGIVEGTPGAQPQDPPMPTDALYIPLYRVPVGTAAPSISAVQDIRPFADRGMQGRPTVTAGFGPPAGGRPGDTAIDGLGNAWVYVGSAGPVAGWAPLSPRVRVARTDLSVVTSQAIAIPGPVQGVLTRYRIQCQLYGSAAPAAASMRFNDDSSAGYYYQDAFSNGSTTQGFPNAGAGGFGFLDLTGTPNLMGATVDIEQIPGSRLLFQWQSGGYLTSTQTPVAHRGAGTWTNTSPLSSITLFATSGTMSGRVDIEGTF